MTRAVLLAVAAFSLGTLAAPAAAIVNSPVPGNAYITFGGIDWAWASACSPTGCQGGFGLLDLSYQGGQGWRLPTAAEWANAPTVRDFLFVGANVPFGGTDPISGASFSGAESAGACAAGYFSSYASCDFGDGEIGAIFGVPNSPYVNVPNVDTWLVRDGGTEGVPEPASWAMLIAGFGLVGATMRQRRRLPA